MARRAHPRSRGEHPVHRYPSGSSLGSSPLARGTPDCVFPRTDCGGLIPARAGNTRCARLVVTGPRAHPRSRGEHHTGGDDIPQRPGSSPLARGTPPNPLRKPGFSGLIPARAGNTLQRPRHPDRRRAHPRSRGEHTARAYTRAHRWGSSPLARGTLGNYLKKAMPIGLIPARAGNTPVRRTLHILAWAHPRSRGEHPNFPRPFFLFWGSSPLARGTHGDPNVTQNGYGLIPARAGNTGLPCQGNRRIWAHPRSRGEHPIPGPPNSTEPGSSPLARGTRGTGWRE